MDPKVQQQKTDTKDVVIPIEVRLFLEDLINESKMPVFDVETKQQLIYELFDRLDKFLSIKLAENLTEEQTDEFIKLNKENKPKEEIDAFLSKSIPDVQDVFIQAFSDFRDFYLSAQQQSEDVIQSGNPQ